MIHVDRCERATDAIVTDRYPEGNAIRFPDGGMLHVDHVSEDGKSSRWLATYAVHEWIRVYTG